MRLHNPVSHLPTGVPIAAAIGSLMAAGFGQVLLLGTGILTARSLGVANRGYFAILTLLPSVISTLCLLAIPTAVTYYLANEELAPRSLNGRLAPILSIQCTIAVILHASAAYQFLQGAPANTQRIGYAFALCSVLLIIQNYSLGILQGLHDYSQFNVLRNLSLTVFFFTLCVIWLAGTHNLDSLAFGWAISILIGTVISTGFALRALCRCSDLSTRPDNITTRDLAKFGAKGFLGYASPSQTFRLDQASIGMWLPASALGTYVVASAFTNFPGFISQSIGLIASPAISSAHNSKDAWRLTRWFIISTTILCATLTLTLIFAAPFLVPLLFGAEYASSISITRILALSAFFLAIKRITLDCMRGLGFPAIGSAAELVSWLVLPPLIAYSISRSSLVWVAWSLVLSAILGAGTCLLLAFYERRKPQTPSQPSIVDGATASPH